MQTGMHPGAGDRQPWYSRRRRLNYISNDETHSDRLSLDIPNREVCAEVRAVRTHHPRDSRRPTTGDHSPAEEIDPYNLPAGISRDRQIGNRDSEKTPFSPSAGIGGPRCRRRELVAVLIALAIRSVYHGLSDHTTIKMRRHMSWMLQPLRGGGIPREQLCTCNHLGQASHN